MHPSRPRLAAVLGPTNTGKTHYALERMLAHRTGVIGLPLRLLAREVYDRLVKLRGPSVVALVTGEERIVPPRAAYWVCTVEAMPRGIGADFVAIDEIQLCADAERGHVFTDRLLNMRGLKETLFLGSDTMRGVIGGLVPGVEFMRRERFSTLSWRGAKKTSRMPARSAIVGFSVESVYAIAELLRRQKGGAAVVMGALSPRTRNAQVAMYQNGEVDYLVATDAIGMGLNLDVEHVAFAALTKFDGRRMRRLMPHEMAQIAGRAGRYKIDGSFGITGEAPPLEPEEIEAIEQHRFAPVRKLQWRNAALEFGSVEALLASLARLPEDPRLTRAREADDLRTLRALAEVPEVRARAHEPAAVRLLWECCQIPDFRQVSAAEHNAIAQRIFEFLREGGEIPHAWLAERVARIDRTDGGIDALSKRLAYIRTWTFVAQRKGWVGDESYWREETRAVEDRLSDALHEALTQRFVDRRTSYLMRRLKQKEGLVAELNDAGEVSVEGQFAGKLSGFRFQLDPKATGDEAKTLRQAAMKALAPQFRLQADRLYNAPDTEFDITEQGGLMWGEHAVGRLARGADPLSPSVVVFVDEEAGAEVAERVRRRLEHFVGRKIAAGFEPLIALRDDEAITGLARGLAFRLVEALGVLPRSVVADDVKALDQDARGLLRKHGVRFGQFTIFQQPMLKPAPTRLRLILWSLWEGFDEFPSAPPPGLVTIPRVADAPRGYYTRAGYRLAGERAIRIDMLERLADLIRKEDTRAGFEATPDMLSITGMTLEQFADLMRGLGYSAERGEREKRRVPAQGAEPAADTPAVAEAGETTSAAAPEAERAAQETPAQETPSEGAQAPSVSADEAPGDAQGEPEAAAPESGEAPQAETGAADGVAAQPEDAAGEPEREIFYTFRWQGRSRAPAQTRRAPQKGKGRDKGKSKPGASAKGPRKASAAPAQARKKEVDPDNPFAVLAALKDKN